MKNFILTAILLLCSVFGYAQVDLAIEDVEVTPQQGYKGDFFSGTIMCSNPGTQDIDDYIIYFYVSKSSVFNANTAIQVGSPYYGNYLNAGSTKVSCYVSFNFPMSVSNPTTSTWYLWAKIESRTYIENQDKLGNNIGSAPITIYGSSF